MTARDRRLTMKTHTTENRRRRLRLGAVVAAVGMTATLAGGASQALAFEVKECSASPVLRTPTQSPRCQTAPVTCEGGAICEVRATVTLMPLVGVGRSGGDVNVYGSEPFAGTQSGLHAVDGCSGPSTGCSVTVTHEVPSRAHSQTLWSLCFWRDTEVALFARINCRLELHEL
jgi:hypothetical protein